MNREFKPIFEYLDKMKAELKGDILDLKEDMTIVKSGLSSVLASIKGFEEEMIVNRHRIDRLEEWARKVSAKTGIPIPF